VSWNPLDHLDDAQRRRLDRFHSELLSFNRRINLISREDEPNVFERHILHCLSLAWKAFPADARIVDWGTGGGLPSIPLAIAFPSVHVTAVDAVAKKVQAVRVMARRLGLENLDVWHGRAEDFPGRVDFSVSRATAALVDLWAWHARVARRHENESVPSNAPSAAEGSRQSGRTLWRRGLLCLKGGSLAAEIAALGAAHPNVSVRSYALDALFLRSYFETKVILECVESDR
jgi:16S rRNA (guanine527-N7)-methyltransferase